MVPKSMGKQIFSKYHRITDDSSTITNRETAFYVEQSERKSNFICDRGGEGEGEYHGKIASHD